MVSSGKLKFLNCVKELLRLDQSVSSQLYTTFLFHIRVIPFFKVGFECGFDEVFYVETLNTLMQNEQHNLAAAKSLRPL